MARPNRLRGGAKPPFADAVEEAVLEIVVAASSVVALGHAALALVESHDEAAGARAYDPVYVTRLEARRRGIARTLDRLESRRTLLLQQLALCGAKESGASDLTTRAA